MSEISIKDEILSKMKLYLDEPLEDNLEFGFLKHAQQVTDFLVNENMPSPFTIAIHGEWGSGKTTLIKKIKKLLDEKIEESQLKWHTIEFDAWEYERLDLVAALLHKIKQEYNENELKSHTKFLTAVGSFTMDAILHKTLGMSKDEATKHFEEFFKQLTTIKDTIEQLVGGGRLIIFVDDLDRCMVENVLDMLEAIKMFLNTKNVIFVIAVDMIKIERAWELRHKLDIGNNEGREHVEKLFQLKLSLPPKSDESLQEFIEKLIENAISCNEIEFLTNICPRNPRKLTRTLNLIYFILSTIELSRDVETDRKIFDTYFSLILIWASITTNHPHIARIIKQSPSYLIQMALLCNEYTFLHQLKKAIPSILEVYKENQTRQFTPNEVAITTDQITIDVINALEYISKNDEQAYKTLRNVGKHFDLKLNTGSKPVSEQMTQFYDKLYVPLKKIITETLSGI